MTTRKLKYQVGDLVIKDDKTWLMIATAESPYGYDIHPGQDYILENEVSQEALQATEAEVTQQHAVGNRDGAADLP